MTGGSNRKWLCFSRKWNKIYEENKRLVRSTKDKMKSVKQREDKEKNANEIH